MKGSEDLKKGLWTAEEDRVLMEHVKVHGKGKWNRVAKVTGLKRGGKSCRLRWMNYLRPEIKLGAFSDEEDELIIRLHRLLGNRWALIAGRVPGRTDNQVKNHWNTHLKKKVLCAKSSRECALAGSVKVGDRVSGNSSFERLNKEGSESVQEMSKSCHEMEDQKTVSTREGETLNGDELFESLSWLWSGNEPWDLLEHDSCAPQIANIFYDKTKQNEINV